MQALAGRRAVICRSRSGATPAVARAVACSRRRAVAVAAQAGAQQPPPLRAVVFDCDGVILESEDLHRRAYNATFARFDVRCASAAEDAGEPGGVVTWGEGFYDMLQNTVGGGKPKMRWYFARHGWPTSSLFDGRAPADEREQGKLVDELQDWKTNKYQEMIGSGEVAPRPGVLPLMDAARAAGLKVAVCSAATKSSVVFTLASLLGKARVDALDCFLAGDDVDRKKPDPTIYTVAAQRLGLNPAECVVVEDSTIGLQAARGAGMRCVITYTPSTRAQAFEGAEAVVHQLDALTLDDLVRGPPAAALRDDRVAAGVVGA